MYTHTHVHLSFSLCIYTHSLPIYKHYKNTHMSTLSPPKPQPHHTNPTYPHLSPLTGSEKNLGRSAATSA